MGINLVLRFDSKAFTGHYEEHKSIMPIQSCLLSVCCMYFMMTRDSLEAVNVMCKWFICISFAVLVILHPPLHCGIITIDLAGMHPAISIFSFKHLHWCLDI